MRSGYNEVICGGMLNTLLCGKLLKNNKVSIAALSATFLNTSLVIIRQDTSMIKTNCFSMHLLNDFGDVIFPFSMFKPLFSKIFKVISRYKKNQFSKNNSKKVIITNFIIGEIGGKLVSSKVPKHC